jgi:hypothetical protein
MRPLLNWLVGSLPLCVYMGRLDRMEFNLGLVHLQAAHNFLGRRLGIEMDQVQVPFMDPWVHHRNCRFLEALLVSG